MQGAPGAAQPGAGRQGVAHLNIRGRATVPPLAGSGPADLLPEGNRCFTGFLHCQVPYFKFELFDDIMRKSSMGSSSFFLLRQRVASARARRVAPCVSCRRMRSHFWMGGESHTGTSSERIAISACVYQATRHARSSSTHLLEEVARRKHGTFCQVSYSRRGCTSRAPGIRRSAGRSHGQRARDQRCWGAVGIGQCAARILPRMPRW